MRMVAKETLQLTSHFRFLIANGLGNILESLGEDNRLGVVWKLLSFHQDPLGGRGF